MPAKNAPKSRKLTAADLKKITGGAAVASAKGVTKGRPSISGAKATVRTASTSARGR